MPEMHFLHLILGPKPLQLNTKSQGKRCNGNSTPPGLGTLRNGLWGNAPPERGASGFWGGSGT